MIFTFAEAESFSTYSVQCVQESLEEFGCKIRKIECKAEETRLFRFLQDTQSSQMGKLGVFQSEQKKRQFLNRLQSELVKRGIVDVLRNGIKVYPVDLIMFYLTPTENNEKAREMFQKNIFSVTRQLCYSQDAGKLALDLCLFINGFRGCRTR